MRKFRKRREAPFKFSNFSTKQKKVMHFWRENSGIKEKDIIIADGAIRSGKTISMVCSFLHFTQETHKGEAFIIAGKSIGALKRNVIKPMVQILRAWGWSYEYNRSENYLTVGSNIYYLFGANNESSQDVLQGLTAAGALADDCALFPQSFLNQMIGRCSVENSKMFLNCNPKSPFHWFKIDFIDKAREKSIYYLHFNMDDNLTLSEKVKNRYKRMFSGVFYKRNILGLWVNAEGVIYDMFDFNKHVVESKPRNYTEHWISCDYGTQNPMAFGLWGKCDGIWYKTKEYHYDGRKEMVQKTDEEYYQDLETFAEGKVKRIIVDPSASSFIALLKKKGWQVKKAKNDVLEGIRNLATSLNRKAILYNDVCTETFKEFSSYQWCEKAVERGEDKPAKEHDHQLDSDRYFVNTIIFKKQMRVLERKEVGK